MPDKKHSFDVFGQLTPYGEKSLFAKSEALRKGAPGLASKWRDPNARRSTNVYIAPAFSQRLNDQISIEEYDLRHGPMSSKKSKDPRMIEARKRLKAYSEGLAAEGYAKGATLDDKPIRWAPFGSID